MNNAHSHNECIHLKSLIDESFINNWIFAPFCKDCEMEFHLNADFSMKKFNIEFSLTWSKYILTYRE